MIRELWHCCAGWGSGIPSWSKLHRSRWRFIGCHSLTRLLPIPLIRWIPCRYNHEQKKSLGLPTQTDVFLGNTTKLSIILLKISPGFLPLAAITWTPRWREFFVGDKSPSKQTWLWKPAVLSPPPRKKRKKAMQYFQNQSRPPRGGSMWTLDSSKWQLDGYFSSSIFHHTDSRYFVIHKVVETSQRRPFRPALVDEKENNDL